MYVNMLRTNYVWTLSMIYDKNAEYVSVIVEATAQSTPERCLPVNPVMHAHSPLCIGSSCWCK